MAQIFISHVEEEAQLAFVLKHWVESAFLGEVEVFVSSHDIHSGEQWFQRLEGELAAAKVLLVICSEKSVSRPWINFETGAGHIQGIPIIPICHSGMDVESLPKPLLFFQGLAAEGNDFSIDLFKGLTKHLGYAREPRLPHEELSAEIKQALSDMGAPTSVGPSSQANGGEDSGFIDHLVSFGEDMESLKALIALLGTASNGTAIETSTFSDQMASAGANGPQRSARQIQRLAQAYSGKLSAYANELESMNLSYAELLPRIDRSSEYVIKFQSPQSDADWESIDELQQTLDTAENAIGDLKSHVIGTQSTMTQLPDFQRDLKRAARKAVDQYGVLIHNLDRNIGLFHKIRSVLVSLERP